MIRMFKDCMARMHRSATLLVASGTLLACEAPTLARPAAAYNPTSLTNGQFYRWPSGSTVRVWYVTPTGTQTRDLRGATLTAISAWNDLPMLQEFQLEIAASLEEANLVILDRASPLPVAPAASCPFDPRGSTGYTYFCPQGNRALKLASSDGGTTRISVVIRVDLGAFSSQTALESVLVHEMGHAIGIGGHSNNTEDVMYGSPITRVPSGRDAQTLQFLLGERTAFTL